MTAATTIVGPPAEVEILEDGSIVSAVQNPNSIAEGDHMSTTTSVMQFTETFMDELCVSVENDLLGKDDTYQAMVRDYRENKHQFVLSDDDDDDDETVVSSSLGSGSTEDLEQIRSELYETKRTKAIIQTLLFGVHRKHKSKSDKKDTKEATAVKVDAHQDSVEVESIEDASSILEKNKKKKSEPSLACTEANTDTSSTTIEEEEVVSTSEETLEKAKVTVNEVLEQLTTVPPPSSIFPSVIDAASIYTELSPHTLERTQTALTLQNKRDVSHTAKIVEQHIQQRKAVYVWSQSVLRQKLQEQGVDVESLPKPQSMHEYDQSILLALGYAMSGSNCQRDVKAGTDVFSMDGSAFELMENKPRLSLSKYMTMVSTKSKSAKNVVQDKIHAAMVPLTLRKRVVKPGSEESNKPDSVDWQKMKADVTARAKVTTQKSFRYVKKEAMTNTFILAMSLKKRAIKLHETLSHLPLENLKMRSTGNKSIAGDVSSFSSSLSDSDSVSLSSSFQSSVEESSMQSSSVQESSLEEQSSVDYYSSTTHESLTSSIQYEEEVSVEVVEPLTTESKPTNMKRKLSKALKKQLSKMPMKKQLSKMPNAKKTMRKKLINQVSKISSATEKTLKMEDSVLFLMDQEDEHDEVTFHFEVAAM